MDDDSSSLERNSSRQRLLDAPEDATTTPRAAGLARHTLGLILLLCVVFLWTMSNFLGSSLFADRTYAKPFFLTYLNTSMFMLAMIPTLFRIAYRRQRKHGDLYMRLRSVFSRRRSYGRPQREAIDSEDSESAAFTGRAKSPSRILDDSNADGHDGQGKQKHLGIAPTARLSLTFCFLWFGANYFAMSCLQHTTVASTTILTSTSSFWTLLIGALTRTEKFTWRKLCGVLGSLVGIILISQVDLSAPTADNDTGGRGSLFVRAEDTFPDKSPSEIAFGDALALLSAIIYGVYTVTLKKTTVKALPRSLNMPLFFGLVGVFNLILLFPLFPVLHYTGIERFRLPPSRRIWTILLVNSVSSLLSDICWAYAMVLTSPLVVTVGLSLTIPLSLVGEMVLQGHYEGWIYWLGAAVVVGSFLFVDHEEREEETGSEPVAAEVQGRDAESNHALRPEDRQQPSGSSGGGNASM
ncbi:putative integral membrane protein [Exophiala viscosa]|uniref:Integral membrane protein n=1 Tax=Exophiala viscosa TaxID=2486360 RepID=A0AAN6DU14_9EURO|nr:putative integral membrane protein [Exophiala viscosa]